MLVNVLDDSFTQAISFFAFLIFETFIISSANSESALDSEGIEFAAVVNTAIQILVCFLIIKSCNACAKTDEVPRIITLVGASHHNSRARADWCAVEDALVDLFSAMFLSTVGRVEERVHNFVNHFFLMLELANFPLNLSSLGNKENSHDEESQLGDFFHRFLNSDFNFMICTRSTFDLNPKNKYFLGN